MKPALKPGVTAEVTVEVTEDMCPAFDGVVVHRVYSTWSLAHHMELAARKVLAPNLEPGEEGIGTHLSIDHLAPTPLGTDVHVTVTVSAVDGRKVTLSASVHDALELVGTGTHVRFLVDVPRQIRRIEEKSRQLVEHIG